MKAISGKDFAKLLEKKGWELRRTKGSHHIYAKGGSPTRISVSIHGNSPLKIGLLRHLGDGEEAMLGDPGFETARSTGNCARTLLGHGTGFLRISEQLERNPGAQWKIEYDL